MRARITPVPRTTTRAWTSGLLPIRLCMVTSSALSSHFGRASTCWSSAQVTRERAVPCRAVLCLAVPRCASLCLAVPRCASLCCAVPRCAVRILLHSSGTGLLGLLIAKARPGVGSITLTDSDPLAQELCQRQPLLSRIDTQIHTRLPGTWSTIAALAYAPLRPSTGAAARSDEKAATVHNTCIHPHYAGHLLVL
jgi:hypothetical protein